MSSESVSVKHWGPCLAEFRLTDDQLKNINALCNKDPQLDARKELAGHIKHEYAINRRELQNILQNCLDGYKKLSNFYHFQKKEGNLKINNAWVNFMGPGEYNPPHIHNKCHVSAVLYLKIPEEIKREFDESVSVGGGPGEIIFSSGLAIEDFITEHKIFPQEGRLFIFPWNLLHFVSPFKSNVERVSVAFNAVWE